MSGHDKDIRAFLLVLSLVVVTRLPFLNTSLGTDADAYRVALTALNIADTGEYAFSRFPGFPVQEYVFALLNGFPPPVFNLISALLSGIGAGFFTLILRRLQYGHSVWFGLALAFTPVVFVNSTTAMDYVWALAFIMASVMAAFTRPWLAGILLGVATGCRFTSLFMLVPLSILFWRFFPAGRFKAVLQGTGMTFATAGLLFLPAILTFEPQPDPKYPQVANALVSFYEATVGVWGVLGLVVVGGLTLQVLALRMRRKSESSLSRRIPQPAVRAAAWWGMGMTGAAFVLYPYEAGYLVPAVPWFLLLLGSALTRNQTIALALGLLVSSFAFGIASADQPESPGPSPLHTGMTMGGRSVTLDVLRGPVPIEFERRECRRELIGRLIAWADSARTKTIIIVGWFKPEIQFDLHGGTMRGEVTFVYSLHERALRYYTENGYNIRYLRGMDAMNKRRKGCDPSTVGAHLLVFD